MQTLNFPEFLHKYANNDKCQELYGLWALKSVSGIKEYGGLLAGGAIRRAILGDNLDSDFDFFFEDTAGSDKFVVDLTKEVQGGGAKVSEIYKNDYNISFTISGLVMKLGNGLETSPITAKIQIITIVQPQSAQELLDSFDFTICQFATDFTNLYCGDTALFDAGRRRLVVNKITYPVASLRRMFKYADQGFYACSGCLKTFLMSVNLGDLSNQPTYID